MGGKAAITPELLVLYRMITVLVFGFFGIYAGFFYWYFGSKDSDYHVDKGTVLVTGVAKLIVFAVFVHAYMAGIVTTIATVIGAGDFILGLFYLKYVFSEPSSDGSKKRPAGRGRGN